MLDDFADAARQHARRDIRSRHHWLALGSPQLHDHQPVELAPSEMRGHEEYVNWAEPCPVCQSRNTSGTDTVGPHSRRQRWACHNCGARYESHAISV